jgi:HEAT repeat protein
VRLLALESTHTTRSSDERANLRATLAMRLGQLGDPRLLVPLHELTGDDDAEVREVASRGMIELSAGAAPVAAPPVSRSTHTT